MHRLFFIFAEHAFADFGEEQEDLFDPLCGGVFVDVVEFCAGDRYCDCRGIVSTERKEGKREPLLNGDGS